MSIIKVDLKHPDNSVAIKSAAILENGGLLVYPTDTAYGLGADALNEEAVRKVYEIKGRDFSKPTHVIVKDWKMIKKIAVINHNAEKLFEDFLPGPLTLILNKKPSIPDVLTAGLPTVGVRIPDNPVTNLISHYLNSPFTTPSANLTGGETPYSIKQVTTQLDTDKIDLLIDAGKLKKNKPSTIVDLTQKKVKILRRGPVLQADIEESLKIKLS